MKLWQQLGLDEFWSARLAPSRKGTRFDQVLWVLVAYRLLSPGAGWRLHRQWFERSALGDLLGADAALADIHTLYACHDRLLETHQASTAYVAQGRSMTQLRNAAWADQFAVVSYGTIVLFAKSPKATTTSTVAKPRRT